MKKERKRGEIIKLSMDLKNTVGLILFDVIMYRLGRSLKLKSNVVIQGHIKKLSKLRNHKKLAHGENLATLFVK